MTKWEQKPISVLLTEAVRTHLTGEGEEADAAYSQFMEIARTLGSRGVEAIDAVQGLFLTGNTQQRSTAVDLFGRMAFHEAPELRDRCFQYLESAHQAESAQSADPEVLEVIASSYGHLEDKRALPSLLRLSTSESAEVRFGVAHSVPGACYFEPVPEATEILVRLSADEDSDVRDWACFGLGQTGADSPAVRAALVARLDDSDVDARCEALLALAKLGDARSYDPIARRLAADEPWALEIEAAGALGDVRLGPRLQELLEIWQGDDDFEYFQPKLEAAIVRCDPERHDLANELAARFDATMAERLRATGLTAQVTGSFPHTRLIVLDHMGTIECLYRLWETDDPIGFDVAAECDQWVNRLAEGNAPLW